MNTAHITIVLEVPAKKVGDYINFLYANCKSDPRADFEKQVSIVQDNKILATGYVKSVSGDLG